MNPNPMVLAHMRSQREHAERLERSRRDVLHRAAVARRRKAKRGGKR